MSHGTRINQSWRIYKGVMSRTVVHIHELCQHIRDVCHRLSRSASCVSLMNHGTHRNKSRHTYTKVTSHMRTSYVTHTRPLSSPVLIETYMKKDLQKRPICMKRDLLKSPLELKKDEYKTFVIACPDLLLVSH